MGPRGGGQRTACGTLGQLAGRLHAGGALVRSRVVDYRLEALRKIFRASGFCTKVQGGGRKLDPTHREKNLTSGP